MNGDVNNNQSVSVPNKPQPNKAGIPAGSTAMATPDGVIRDNGGDKGQSLVNPSDSSYSEYKGSK